MDRLVETLQCYLHDESNKFESYAEALAKQIKAMPSDEVKLISHETYLRPADIERTATRLKNLFSGLDVSVIFTVRRQQSLILSRMYHDKQFLDLTEGQVKSNLSEQLLNCTYPTCHSVKDGRCQQTCEGRRKLSLPYYNYDKVTSVYEKVFGEDRVDVFSFEKIFSVDDRHMERLGRLFNTGKKDLGDIIRKMPQSNKAKSPEEYKAFKVLFSKECGNYIDEILHG